MGRIAGMLASMVVYLCVGTVLASAVVAGYLWKQGTLDRDKLLAIVAVVQGVAAPAEEARRPAASAAAAEQLSFDDLERRRSLQSRNQELREQAIVSGLDLIRTEQRKLTNEKDEYERLRARFQAELKDQKDRRTKAGQDEMRQILENVKPKQAKELILNMIAANEQDQVVTILSSMPIGKRAKIVGEFKSDEEAKQLDDILQRMLEGVPDVQLIDQALDELQKFDAKKTDSSPNAAGSKTPPTQP